MYLGYGKFVQTYQVGERTVGIDLYTKRAALVSDIVSGLTPPEKMPPIQAAQAAALWAGYSSYALSVPIRNMADVPGLTNHCGPTAGAEVDEYYDGYRSYPAFENWYADGQSLYVFMETNLHWPGGTLLPYAKSGWLAYAGSRGYSNFSGGFMEVPPLGGYGETIADYIVHFNPLLIMFDPWSSVYPSHWVAIWGFTPNDVDPSRMMIFVNDGWGSTGVVDLAANASHAQLVFVAPTGPIVNGKVVLQGSLRPSSYTEIPLAVRVFNPGATWSDWANNYVAQATLTTNNAGVEVGFATPTLLDRQGQPLVAGTYDVAVKAGHTLANIRRNVPISHSDPLSLLFPPKLDMGTLLEGNANDDGQITIIDFSILAGSYLKSTGQQGFDSRADFDWNGTVHGPDFALLAANYLKSSFQQVGSGAGAGMGGEGLLTLGTADLTLQPATQTVSVNQTFSVTIQAAAGTQQVSVIDAFVDFDPAYLEVVSVTSGTALPVELLNQYDNQLGTIDFSGGKLSGTPPSGTFTLATVQFRAKAQTSGSNLTFAETGNRESIAAYQGDSVLGSLTGATVVIQP